MRDVLNRMITHLPKFIPKDIMSFIRIFFSDTH